MKLILTFWLLISFLFSQDIFVQEEEKNLYRSAVEYSFDEVLDNGAYTFILDNLSGVINIIGHAGSGSHLIIDNRIRAVSNKNAIKILQNSQINIYHDKNKKKVSIKKLSERYDHKIITNIDLHIPINTNIKGSIKNSDVKIGQFRGSLNLKAESTDSDLNNLSGNVVFSTKGGNINAKKLNGTIRLHVVSGNINIEQCDGNIFTSSENGSIEMSKINGEIESITTLGNINITNADSRNCSISLNVGNLIARNCNANIEANIDVGNITMKDIKGDLTLFTGKGIINLNDIIGDTKCNSNFGNITGINLFGSVSASSELGDLNINKGYNSFLTNHKIDLKTKRGSVALRIPSDLPFLIRAHCNNLNSKNAISSDIALIEEIYPTKVIAKGEIKNGTINCNIQSNYGPISINTN
ncbi:MAG: hypothetical protein CBD77_02875 [bacterium TMED217]|nr:MAG: hypothetical protein CBD77_02875 [bacterium TMED217]